MEFNNIWQGQLVRLRAVEPGDWEAFFDANQDTDIASSTYSIPFPGSREIIAKWTAEMALAGQRDHAFRWVIENLDGEFVGTFNTHSCDPRIGVFYYGVSIRRPYWRKGYATDAIRLVLRYYFDELRYQKVNVTIYAFNEASIKLHEKLGFRQEGRLRRTVFTGGKYYDEILMGLTVEEFKAQP
jgi:RimJ/RimL family protein N-acetyltransferase